MKELEDRILKDGRALNADVLLVDSFLNHQVDVQLMQHVGQDFAEHFKNAGIDRVATIESSGIAPAAMTALVLNVPLVIMKKASSAILSDEDSMTAKVHSFTKNTDYTLKCKRCYINRGDRVLFIDDFLANGEAGLGAAKLIEEAGATVAGIGIVIEKAFQSGAAKLAEKGYEVYSLARVGHMDKGVIEFA